MAKEKLEEKKPLSKKEKLEQRLNGLEKDRQQFLAKYNFLGGIIAEIKEQLKEIAL